eukprot:scaffold32159_cov34-Cyclotella_meneghiniana.AAC.1
MKKDTRSVCHLKDRFTDKRYLFCLSPQKLWGATPRPLLQEFRFRDIAAPRPPHLGGRQEFRFGGAAPPEPPARPQPPASLFRSNRKDIRSVCHLKINYMYRTQQAYHTLLLWHPEGLAGAQRRLVNPFLLPKGVPI